MHKSASNSLTVGISNMQTRRDSIGIQFGFNLGVPGKENRSLCQQSFLHYARFQWLIRVVTGYSNKLYTLNTSSLGSYLTFFDMFLLNNSASQFWLSMLLTFDLCPAKPHVSARASNRGPRHHGVRRDGFGCGEATWTDDVLGQNTMFSNSSCWFYWFEAL